MFFFVTKRAYHFEGGHFFFPTIPSSISERGKCRAERTLPKFQRRKKKTSRVPKYQEIGLKECLAEILERYPLGREICSVARRKGRILGILLRTGFALGPSKLLRRHQKEIFVRKTPRFGTTPLACALLFACAYKRFVRGARPIHFFFLQ